MTLRVQEYHDCPSIRPDMIVGTKTIVERSTFWPWTKEVTKEVNVYDQRNAEWTCPVCKSVWEYSPYLFTDTETGFWRATKRQYTWKTIQ